MKYSIIIPIYNASEFLAECLDSIAGQSYNDYEALLIDDGSTDESVKICEKYSVDERFVLIKKENGGVSSARNLGLEKASGEYVLFVDSDDILPKNALSDFDFACKESDQPVDLVFGRTATFEKSANQFSYNGQKYIGEKQKSSNLIFLWTKKHITNAVWGIAYKRKIIADNNIIFDKALSMGEDGDWLINFLLHAHSFAYTDSCVYLYRQDESASNFAKIGFKYAYSSWKYQSKWFDFFAESYDESDKNEIITKIANSFLSMPLRISYLSKNDKQKMKKLYKEKDYILKSCSKNYKLLYALYKIFGFGFLAFLLKIIFKFKGIK